MIVSFKHQGDFKNLEKFLKTNKDQKTSFKNLLTDYGRRGVEILKEHTPKDTGKTANSWTYSVSVTKQGFGIEWTNTNKTASGIPVVILLQYGHATGTGGFVKGRDFINPAMQPLFDQLVEELWEEVTK